jgi:tight adherence protein C
MTPEILFILSLIGCVTMAGFSVWWSLAPDRGDVIRQRLARNPDKSARGGGGGTAAAGVAVAAGAGSGLKRFLEDFSRNLGDRVTPDAAEQRTTMRDRMAKAGFYRPGAQSLYFGGRLLLTAGGLVGGVLAGSLVAETAQTLLLAAVTPALAGYLLPTFWLDFRIRGRQRRLEHALPDALDLLVVCVESGLTVDAGFQRVGREIGLAHPELARELAIAHMESQMGVPRNDALRNIARRTGSKALQSLAAMLIQADRFGTSIAQSLRVYSESLRTKRRTAAEERAGKAAVKMTIPLVLCIFPALMIVAAGPAMIRLMEFFAKRT